MICESCKILIKPEFTYAIKNNQCPACGKSIMQQAKLAAYLSLRTLLGSCYSDTEVDKITSLITANFEFKQIFKEELQTSSKEGIMKVEDEEEMVVEAVEVLARKTKQKDALQKMRDEALAGALDGQGIGLDEGEILIRDDISEDGAFRRSV